MLKVNDGKAQHFSEKSNVASEDKIVDLEKQNEELVMDLKNLVSYFLDELHIQKCIDKSKDEK